MGNYFLVPRPTSCKWAKVDRSGNRINVFLLRETVERNDLTENIPVGIFDGDRSIVEIKLDTEKELPVKVALNNNQVVGTISSLEDKSIIQH